MDIRNFLPRKRSVSEELDGNEEDRSKSDTQVTVTDAAELSTSCLQSTSSTKASYRPQWESTYPWVYCNDPEKGMFCCCICQKHGKPPANARGAWTLQGIVDWNHGTEMLKQHNNSKWHKDAAVAARMAEQSQHSVLELQCAAAARAAAEKREKNRALLLKLLRSIYFLIKHRVPHTTTFQDFLALQVANGDELLGQHITDLILLRPLTPGWTEGW